MVPHDVNPQYVVILVTISVSVGPYLKIKKTYVPCKILWLSHVVRLSSIVEMANVFFWIYKTHICEETLCSFEYVL